MSCIFCRILTGELEASVIYQDEVCTAFMDVQPVNPGHVLVIPNSHASSLADLPLASGAQIFQIAQRLTAALRTSGLRCEGVNFFLADGEAAMQEVFHVHLHVFPRFGNDGFGLKFPPDYARKPPRQKLDETAEAISKALAEIA